MSTATAQQVTALPPTREHLVAEVAHLARENKSLRDDLAYYMEMVRKLKRMHFAPKSETTPPGQGTIFNEAEHLVAEAKAAVDAEENAKKKRNRGKPKRNPFPDHLPRVEVTIDLPADQKVCPKTQHPLTLIGAETSQQLDVVPAKAQVIVTNRLKYACKGPCCAGGDEGTTIKAAPVQPQPIPKGIATANTLAWVACNKYVDGLPLYRVEELFRRMGIDVTRQTMAGWLVKLGEMLTPIINLMKDKLFESRVIYADETRLQVLTGTGKAATALSYVWVLMRGGENGEPNVVLYDLGPTRGHEVPLRLLAGYEGHLHTDGYEAYDTLEKKMPKIIHVGDWVHVRRKFDEAAKSSHDPKTCKSNEALAMINELFRIERTAAKHGVTEAELLRIRDTQSRPIVEKLKAWVDELSPQVRPKSLLGKALAYLLGQWPKLLHFLEKPYLRLDTNLVENAIRPFVVGRKAWLFSATVQGADASAALYSIVVTARANGLEPFEYLKRLFEALPRANTPEDYEALLPWKQKAPPSTTGS